MKKPWFGAKRFGFGASPVSWEGWAVTVLWVVLTAGSARLLAPYGPERMLAAMMLLLVAFLVIVALTNDGQRWFWRWGDGE